MSQQIACNLCGGREHKQVYPRSAASRLKSPPPAGYTISASEFEKPERLLRCRECGLVFAALDHGEHHLIRRDYHEMEDPAYLHEEKGRRRQAQIILDRIPPRGKRALLDVGCGPGILLDEARRRGWDVVGVDLSTWACEHARSTYGLRAVQGTLQEAGFADGTFDVIVMNDVLEHLDDPKGALAEIRRILRDDGFVYLSTIDIESLLSRVLGGWWWGINRHHLFYFSRRTLDRMFREAGLESLGYFPYPRVFSFGYWARRLESYPFFLSWPFRKLAGLGSLGDRLLRIDLRDQIWVTVRKAGA